MRPFDYIKPEVSARLKDWDQKPSNRAKDIVLTWQTAPVKGDIIHFPRDPQITLIKGIEIISAAWQTAIVYQNTVYTTPNADQFKDAIIHLVDDRNRTIVRFPLSILCPETNQGKFVFMRVPVKFDNCFIRFYGNSAGLTTAEAFKFNFWI